MKLVAALFGFLITVTALCEPAERPFYAFENGVRFSSHQEKAAALKKLGFDGIGSAALPNDGDVEGMLKTYQDHGVQVFSFYVGIDLDQSGKTRPDSLLELIPKLKGSGAILELTIQGKKSANSDKQAAVLVRKIATLAKAADINIALYPHTGFYIATIGDAVRVAKECDHPNVGVMFNLCHFLKVEPDSDLTAALKSAKPYLRQVSVSGATVGGTNWSELIQPLGDGDFDLSILMTSLNQLQYTGPVGLQCYNIKGDSMDFLEKSISTWKTFASAKKQ